MARSRPRGCGWWFALVLVVAFVVPMAPAQAETFDRNPATSERVDRTDPVEAALDVSRARFPADSARRVVLSRDDVFADALAGAPLTNQGPMLFTPSSSLLPAVRTEIDRALPAGGRVYLLGGTSALSQGIEDQLRQAGYDVVRLRGSTRVETSIAVAREVRRVHPGATEVAVARAWGTDTNPTAGWADSVTGGAWATHALVPIVHTPTDTLTPAVAAFLDEVRPTSTILFGGTAALSSAVANAVPNPRRVSGPVRSDTAAAIVRQLWGGAHTSGDRRFVVMDGYRTDGWMFGLAAAGISSDWEAPLLLLHPQEVPDGTRELVASCDTPRVDLLLMGSTSVIPTWQQQALDAEDGKDCSGTGTTCADDGYEDNDQRSGAPLVAPGVAHEGLRLCPDDVDWFGIDLEIGQDLSLDGFYDGPDPTIHLYAPDGTLVDTGGAADGHLALRFTANTLGRFTVRFASTGTTDYEFLFQVTTPTSCEDDRFAPNQQPSLAHDLGWADTTEGGLVLCEDATEDWFRINTSDGDRVTFEALFEHDEGDIDLQVQDASGQVIARADGTEDNEGMIFFSDGGDLYLRVELVVDTGEPGSVYALHVAIDHVACPDDDLEPNDSNAAWIVPGYYDGLTSCRDDADWFLYMVDDGNSRAEHRVTLYAPSSEGDLRLTIFDDNGGVDEVAETDGGGGVSLAYTPAFGRQRVWVRVDLVADRGGVGVPYDLEFAPAVGPRNVCPPEDFAPDNDTSSGAVRLTHSVTGIFEVVCSGDADWYRVWARLGQTITIQLDGYQLAADLDLELFDPTGAFVQASTGPGGDEQIVATAGVTGFHTFRVYLFDTDVGPSEAYALDVRVT